MIWDNAPIGAVSEWDRLEAQAESNEAFADLVAEHTYDDARLNVAAFEAALDEQCETPSGYWTAHQCELMPERLPEREEALAIIVQLHSVWLVGDTPIARRMEKIVCAHADYQRALALERGAPPMPSLRKAASSPAGACGPSEASFFKSSWNDLAA